MTLGRWFLAWMLLVTVLTLGLSVVVVTVQEHRALTRQLENRARSVARTLVYDRDAGPVAIAALPECVSAKLSIDGRGLVWSFGPSADTARDLDPDLLEVREFVDPGMSDQAPAEVVFLLSTTAIRNQVLATGSRLSVTLALALGITLIVGIFLVNRVVEPIQQLSREVRDFSIDGSVRVGVPKSGAIEVVDLALSFRTLLDRLVEQRRSLQEQEERYRALFIGSPTPLFEVDRSLEIVGANPAADSLAQNKKGASNPRNISDFLTLDGPDAELPLPRHDDSETISEAEWLLPTGDRAQVELHCRRISKESGVMYLVAVHDLTERLRQAAERWRLTFDEMSDGVALLDAEGGVLQANRAIEDFLTPIVSDIQNLSTQEQRHEWQMEIGGRDLQCLHLSTDIGGQRILVARDITDWLSTEKRLREAQKMEAVASLAGGIAHDFNNLLAGVLLQLRLLERKPAARDDVVSAIRSLAEEGSDVVRGLLDFAHPERSPQQRVDLAEVVGDQAPMLRHLMPPTIHLQTELAPATVYASASDLRRVLLNLVLNARAAIGTDAGSIRVVVRAEESDSTQGRAILEVIDDGPGIPLEERERIFEPFFTRRRQGRGAGIGLAVVYAIVRDHDGHITVSESAQGGAHFRLEIPLCDNETTSEQRSEARPDMATSEGHGARLLIVEDEGLIATRLAEEFAAAGFEVRCANSQASARTICATFEPEVMVVDLLLPDGRGDDLVHELRHKLGQVPVVFNSGHAHAQRAQLESLSAAAVVAKPQSFEVLIAATVRLLNERRQADPETIPNREISSTTNR